MLRFLGKLVNLRPDEWPRVLLLYLTLFVANAGFFWGQTTAIAEFSQPANLAYLPALLIGSALLSMLVSSAYTAVADRVSNTRLLIVIMLFIGLGIGASVLLLRQGWPVVPYLVLYLHFSVAVDLFNLHWVTYITSFYDTQAAKRIFPLVESAARIAVIVAGLLTPGLNMLFGAQATPGFLALWLLTVILAGALVVAMPFVLRERTPRPVEPLQRQRGAYLDGMREGYRFVISSPFLRWMALANILLVLITTLLLNQVTVILSTTLGSTQERSNFLAAISTIGSLAMLPFLFTILGRIIARIGVANASLIFPLGNLLLASGLVFAPGAITAGAAFFSRGTFLNTFHFTLDSLLYNAVPLRVKGRARAFIGGLVVPLGALVAGALPLLPLPTATRDLVLRGLIGLLLVAYLAVAFALRRSYTRALIALLEQEDFSFLLSQDATELAAADPATLAVLRQKLEASATPELALFMAKLISQVAGAEAVPMLSQAAHAAADARVRAGILDTLAASGRGGAAVRQLYADFLADPDGRVRLSALAALEALVGLADPLFRTQAMVLLADPDLAVRAQVLPPLLRAGLPHELQAAEATLAALLGSASAAERVVAVQTLASLADARAVRLLAERLTDSADEVRLAAAVGLESLAGTIPHDLAADLLAQVSRLVQDPVERAREAAVALAGTIGTAEARLLLVAALADASPTVRAAAADTLVGLGKVAIPLVYPCLDAPDAQMRKMATVILSRVDRREFGGLIEALIAGNLLAIYQNHGVLAALTLDVPSVALGLMRSTLREQNDQLREEVFYLLAALHDGGSVRVVAASLRSGDVRVRANAAEALESLTSPQSARLIVPLCDNGVSTQQLLAISRDAWEMQHPDAAGCLRALAASVDPWQRALALFALGELVAASQPLPPPASPTPRERPRRRAADLLASLAAEPPAQAVQREQSLPVVRPELLPRAEVEALLAAGCASNDAMVRSVALAATRKLAGETNAYTQGENSVLSAIEKIIFLKEVPFFQDMTVDQLKVLAAVCEEQLFERDGSIFREGEPGGTLYVVVSGRVAIEAEKRKGSFARLATIEAHSYFGEMSLFDTSSRSASAIALQDTLTLKLRREPLIALARQHPDLSLKLINVLSQRLREANDRVAELTRNRPRELHKFFDRIEEES